MARVLKDENQAFQDFITEKCEKAEKPLNIYAEARNFCDLTGSQTKEEALRSVARRYSDKIKDFTDEKKRARHLFALSVKVKEDLKEKLDRHARVVLNSDGKIIEYEAFDGSLKLKGDQSALAKSRTAKRTRRMVAATKKAKDDDSPDSDSASDSRPPTPQKIKHRRPVSSARRPTRSTSKPSAPDRNVAHAPNHSCLAKLRTAKQMNRMTPAIKKDEDEDSSDADSLDFDFSLDSRPATPQKTRPRTPMSSVRRPTQSTSKPSASDQKLAPASKQPVGAPSSSNFVRQTRGSSVRQPTQSTFKPSTSSRQKSPDHKNPQSHRHSSVSIRQTRGFGTPPQAAVINLPARAADP